MHRATTARTADRKRTVHNLVMISIGRTRVMNKPKKKKKVTRVDIVAGKAGTLVSRLNRYLAPLISERCKQ